jgi:hypothetical protein
MQTTLLGYYSLKNVGSQMIPIVLALFRAEHMKVIAYSVRRHKDD